MNVDPTINSLTILMLVLIFFPLILGLSVVSYYMTYEEVFVEDVVEDVFFDDKGFIVLIMEDGEEYRISSNRNNIMYDFTVDSMVKFKLSRSNIFGTNVDGVWNVVTIVKVGIY